MVAVKAMVGCDVEVVDEEAESSPMLNRLQAIMERVSTPAKITNRFLHEVFIDASSLLSMHKSEPGSDVVTSAVIWGLGPVFF